MFPPVQEQTNFIKKVADPPPPPRYQMIRPSSNKLDLSVKAYVNIHLNILTLPMADSWYRKPSPRLPGLCQY